MQSPHSTFQQAKKQVRKQAKTVASGAREQARDLAHQARGHVEELVEQKKDLAADRLGSLAEALREAGETMDAEQPVAAVAPYTDLAARQVERLSRYVRENDLSRFVRDTETFARRRPELFLGGSLIAGLMLARFLKASRPTPVKPHSLQEDSAWIQ
jgi:DNA repair exonuclease SbcCD ATPase subunit